MVVHCIFGLLKICSYTCIVLCLILHNKIGKLAMCICKVDKLVGQASPYFFYTIEPQLSAQLLGKYYKLIANKSSFIQTPWLSKLIVFCIDIQGCTVL